VGQIYTFVDRVWRWNGTAWPRVVNYGQNAAVLVGIDEVGISVAGFDAAQVPPAFVLVNYV